MMDDVWTQIDNYKRASNAMIARMDYSGNIEKYRIHLENCKIEKCAPLTYLKFISLEQ